MTRAGFFVLIGLFLPALSLAAGVDPIGLDASGAGADGAKPRAFVMLPLCEGGVLAAFGLKSILPARKSSEMYARPDEETLRAIGDSIRAVRAGDGWLALERAAFGGYELCAGQGDETGIVLWRPEKSGIGQALFAWRASGARPVIVEVPHSVYDYLTLEEGVRAFESLLARGIIVSGTHRCANSGPSGCEGMSAVCSGEVGPYRESDMAHATETVFQTAHAVFSEESPRDLVVSLHGKASAGVIISDGTAFEADPSAPVTLLAGALRAVVADGGVASCNERESDERDVEDLCGTLNVQGRHLNGSPESCTEQPSGASGRFLHIEQSIEIRRNHSPILVALDRVVPR